MLAPLFARLFGRTKRHPIEKSPRRGPAVRLRAEALETREVPASLVWTNATGTGLFALGANWYDLDADCAPLLQPGQGDAIYFDGAVSNADCVGLTGAIAKTPKLGEPLGPLGEYASVNLVNGYAGTVTTFGGFATGGLVLTSGALSQPWGSLSDVRVSEFFHWTGGTLGGTHADPDHPDFAASNSTLRLMAGSVSHIDPGAGRTVATGDTLSFEGAGGVGSTATFHSGSLHFAGGLGVVVNQWCAVTAEAQPATVTFVDTPQPLAVAKFIRVKAGGKVYVRGAGTFDSAIPVLNYGTFQVEGGATALIRGAVALGNPATDPSFYQDGDGAAIKIENGSKLATEKGLSFLGGTLATLERANPPQGFAQTATVAGKVSLTSGHVYINQGTDPHVFGTLVFESDVWLGAVTLHVVVDGRAPGTGDAGKSDLFDFRACLRDGLAQPVLKIKTVNVPQGGLNQNQMWEFVKAANPIAAHKPTVVSETQGVNFQVIDVNQNKWWRLEPVA
jgi:hypothetical protein